MFFVFLSMLHNWKQNETNFIRMTEWFVSPRLRLCLDFVFETMKMLTQRIRLKTIDKLNPRTLIVRLRSMLHQQGIIYSSVFLSIQFSSQQWSVFDLQKGWWKKYRLRERERENDSTFYEKNNIVIHSSSLIFRSRFFFSLLSSMSTTSTWRIASGKTMKGRGSFGKYVAREI